MKTVCVCVYNVPVSFFCTIVFAHDSGEEGKGVVDTEGRERIERMRDRAACTFICVHNVHRTSGSVFSFFRLFVCCMCACVCKYYVTTGKEKKNVVRELSIFFSCRNRRLAVYGRRDFLFLPRPRSGWFRLFVENL